MAVDITVILTYVSPLMERDPALVEAIALAGGPASIGRELGISHAAVAQWKRCPAERAIQLEKLTEGQITRHQLRPDLYPVEITHRASKPYKSHEYKGLIERD